LQDERIKEDAKQLLRVAYERQEAGDEVGMPEDTRTRISIQSCSKVNATTAHKRP